MASYPPPQNLLPIFNQIEYYDEDSTSIDTSNFMKKSGGVFTGNVNFAAGLNSQTITMGNNNLGADQIKMNFLNTLTSTIGNNSLGSISWRSVVYSPELNLFVTVKTGGNTKVGYSINGTAWNFVAPSGGLDANQWYGITWAKELGLFVAVGATIGSTPVMTSPDGINWTGRIADSNSTWVSVDWSPELGLLAAVANTGTNRVMTSPNGIDWTVGTISTIGNVIPYNAICWSADKGIFSAVGGGSTGFKCLTSSNGITWTPSRCADEVGTATSNWKSIIYCPEINLFISTSTGTEAGFVGNAPYVQISVDGISWIGLFLNPFNWRSIPTIKWCPEIGLAIAVCYNDGNNTIMTYDGNEWTTLTNSSLASTIWESLAWNGLILLGVSSSGSNQSFNSNLLNYIDTIRNGNFVQRIGIYKEKIQSLDVDRINSLTSINTTKLSTNSLTAKGLVNFNVPPIITNGAIVRSTTPLIPFLTGYSGTANGITFTVSASSEYSAQFSAWRPCQETPSDWATNAETTNFWWKVEMSIPQRIWQIRSIARTGEVPVAAYFQGSNDDVNWYIIGQHGTTQSGSFFTIVSNIDYNSAWKYIRLFSPTSTGGINPGLRWIQLFRII